MDSKHSRQPDFTFPPSPPSSATVTANSSPRLSALIGNDPPIIGHYFPRPVFRRANSHTTNPWGQQVDGSGTDSDESATTRRRRGSTASSNLLQKKDRSSTVPSSRSSVDRPQIRLSPTSVRHHFHKSSYASSSSSTSSGDGLNVPPTTSANAGIGRKVAASLQLFKETVGSSAEDLNLVEGTRPEVSLGRHKTGSSHKLDGVAEAQFEFVKRSEWPDREAAAIRRGESSTGLSRVRTRDSVSDMEDVEPNRGKERKASIRDSVIHDLTQWRKDVMARHEIGRGRRLERASGGLSMDAEVVPLTSASSFSTTSSSRDIHEPQLPSSSVVRSRTYPPSPSPSRSPLDRIPQLSSSHTSTDLISSQDVAPTRSNERVLTRSSTPIQTPGPLSLPPTLISPYPPSFSPWTTDDESGWETASVTTSTSTTSATSFHHMSSSQTHTYSPPFVKFPGDHDDEELEPPYPSLDGVVEKSDDADALEADDDFDLDLDMSQGGLPHIPLRPFRNQVGGHSAIYKFTKRAVCKVRLFCAIPF